MLPRRLAIASVLVLSCAALAFAGALEDGQKALDERRFADAATAFGKALEASPGSRAAALGLARSTTEGKVADRYDAAETALRTLIRNKPDGFDREARLALGHLYLARVAEDDRWRADAQEQFQAVLDKDPADEEAAAGVAQMYWQGGDAARGIKTLDQLLEKKPDAATALYWKGFLLYDEAKTAFESAGALTDETKAQFKASLEALQASTKADPKRVDAWIETAYAAQYLAGTDPSMRGVAEASYRKALDLDGESDPAIRGLSALYRLEGSRWVEVLDALAKEKPNAPIVLYWYGDSLRARKRYDEAEKTLRAMVKVSHSPADGWYAIGQTLEEKGDAQGAAAAYRKFLEIAPRHPRAVNASTALLKPLYDRMRDAQGDAAKMRPIVKEATAILALAPTDMWARNNVGFVCRETFGSTKDPYFLDASVRAYVEASAMIPEWNAEFEQRYPYPSRHQYAQLLNDTGLMFQYYEQSRDLAKAESYYRKAQEWTQNGYWDAYGNLVKILVAQQRWKDLVEYANDCAEGLKNEDGSPNETYRGAAKADAAKYADKVR